MLYFLSEHLFWFLLHHLCIKHYFSIFDHGKLFYIADTQIVLPDDSIIENGLYLIYFLKGLIAFFNKENAFLNSERHN